MSASVEKLKNAQTILWGSTSETKSFLQWNQPFIFSEKEPSALMQRDGGPCAVLAPIQAEILSLITRDACFSAISSPSAFQAAMKQYSTSLSQTNLLATALSKILLRSAIGDHVALVKLEPPESTGEMDFNMMHESMKIHYLDRRTESVEKKLESFVSSLFISGGVLAFVYSLILSRTVEGVEADLGALESGPLIDEIHGHGSIALTNLCLTGAATPYLFDGAKDIGGMVLNGIQSNPEIGYLSLLEHYRYIEVGYKMKAPKLPCWLLSTETHLTVLCSLEKSLCSASASDRVKQTFSKYDANGNGFIQEQDLEKLLKDLDLPADSESLASTKSRLDTEDLGIITLGSIIQTFYPELLTASEFEVITDVPFIHYNGMMLSSEAPSDKVDSIVEGAEGFVQESTAAQTCYSYGSGVVGLASLDAGTATKMDLILATKWPAIQINWSTGPTPCVD